MMRQNHYRKKCFTVMQSLLIILFLFCVATPAMSVPNLISYQGVLMDSGGVPVDGPVNMSFSVYDVETEGTALWSEDHAGVELDNGVYNVLLGDGWEIPRGYKAQQDKMEFTAGI